MTLRIEAGVNTAKGINLSAEFDDTSADALQLSGTFCHTDLSAVLGTGLYVELAQALEDLLNASVSLTATYTVTYDPVALSYTISATGTFSVDFTSVSSSLLGQALGFSSMLSGASSYTSTVRPFYLLTGTCGGKSQVSDDYEPDNIVETAEAEDGTTYSRSRFSAPIYQDFRLPLEPRARVFKRRAEAAVPWTFQHFHEHVRGQEPFLLVDDAESTVHVLRKRSAAFAPSRVVQDFDDYWDLEMNTYVKGRL